MRGGRRDAFGSSVAITGNTVIVGASKWPNHAAQGKAYVFVNGGSQELTASDGATGGQFGHSVAVSGETAIIGASGAAYIFVGNGSSWTEQQRLTPPNIPVSAVSSVAIAGDTVIVGVREVTVTLVAQGAVYVLKRTGTIWTQQQMLVAPDPGTLNFFGFSVALFGETLVVGAPNNDVQGAAYVFYGCGDQWTFQQRVVAFDRGNEYSERIIFQINEEFGHSVAISDDTGIFGAWGEDANLGQTEEDIDFGPAYLMPRSEMGVG